MKHMGLKPTQEKIWMNQFPHEAAEVEIPKCKIYTHLKASNKDRLDGVALNYYKNKITWKELFKMIDNAADAFAAIGVKEGDVVSFLSVAVPECIAAVYALNKIGAAANMIDPRMDTKSISRMIRESGSKVLVTIDLAFPKVRKIFKEIKQKKIIVQSPTSSLLFVAKVAMNIKNKNDIYYDDVVLTWKTFMAGGRYVKAKEAQYVGDATVAIAYTGGTTGFPKGVMLTNDSMNAVVVNFRHCGLYYEAGQRFLGIIPIFSTYGMVCGMHMPLCLGCELVPIPAFSADKFGKLIRQFRPHHMISTPAFYEMLMDSKEMKNFDLSFLITLGSGGDTMNEGLEQKLKHFMKTHNIKYPLAQGYGMSELSAAASFCVNDIYKPFSVGVPSVTTTIGIFNPETGEELDYNEKGEICVTGPSMMKGYFNQPEETAYVMRKHEDGRLWIHSGDLGYMDEDGFVFIIGRYKRMITRFDGHKVFPVNLESMVSEHEAIHNCVTIGVNDRGHGQGQYPLVIIEADVGADKEALCREIFEFCDENVEERGKPVAVLAIDEIPLTGMGKNDYRALEAQYKDYDYTQWKK